MQLLESSLARLSIKFIANKDVDSRQTEIQSLKADIKELKSLFTSMNIKSFQEVDDDQGFGSVVQGPMAES